MNFMSQWRHWFQHPGGSNLKQGWEILSQWQGLLLVFVGGLTFSFFPEEVFLLLSLGVILWVYSSLGGYLMEYLGSFVKGQGRRTQLTRIAFFLQAPMILMVYMALLGSGLSSLFFWSCALCFALASIHRVSSVHHLSFLHAAWMSTLAILILITGTLLLFLLSMLLAITLFYLSIPGLFW